MKNLKYKFDQDELKMLKLPVSEIRVDYFEWDNGFILCFLKNDNYLELQIDKLDVLKALGYEIEDGESIVTTERMFSPREHDGYLETKVRTPIEEVDLTQEEMKSIFLENDILRLADQLDEVFMGFAKTFGS
jgi:hypothetical protein